MKHITTFALIAAAVAALGTSAAFADDQQLQNRLALQRAQMERNRQTTTVAVYASRHGVSQRSTVQDGRSENVRESRPNAHGHTFDNWAQKK